MMNLRRSPTFPALVAAPVLLAALVAALAHAADPVIVKQWKSPDALKPEFRRILVVGITKDAAARRKYEDLFVSHLRGRSYEGITSYKLVPDLENVTDPEAVLQRLFAEKVEGVITARLAPLEDKKEEEWDAAWRADVESPVEIRPYVARSIVQSQPGAKDVGPEFSLWEVATGHRLWAARTAPQKIKSLRKNAPVLVQSVMEELRAHDLL